MKVDPILNKAVSLAKKRNFDAALKILKDEEDRYYGSFKFYYLYGLFCLYSGNFVEAKENFDMAKKIKMKDTSTMLGQAVLHLRKINTSQAVDYYLDILELDPNNKIAKKALFTIRKNSASEALSDWMSDNLSKLFPPIPSPALEPAAVVKGALFISAAVILTLIVLLNFKVLSSPFKKQNLRVTTDFALSNQERNEPVETGGSYMYILTRDNAVKLYEEALSLFSEFRDEKAKININRILESNAAEAVKNRSRLMLESMNVPGFDNFKKDDNVSYSNVITEPVLYRDVHVIWRGMASNYELTDEKTSFHLLVGYDTRRTLEGIVPVVFRRPVSIDVERPLEVLGKITVTETMGITLEGAAIHQSGRLEN